MAIKYEQDCARVVQAPDQAIDGPELQYGDAEGADAVGEPALAKACP